MGGTARCEQINIIVGHEGVDDDKYQHHQDSWRNAGQIDVTEGLPAICSVQPGAFQLILRGLPQGRQEHNGKIPPIMPDIDCGYAIERRLHITQRGGNIPPQLLEIADKTGIGTEDDIQPDNSV